MGELIFSNDEQKRIVIIDNSHIRVDLHGMNRKSAKRFLKNLIALNRNSFELEVIHGYNHGTALKSMISSEILSNRESEIMPVKNNMGRTIISIA